MYERKNLAFFLAHYLIKFIIQKSISNKLGGQDEK